MIEKNKINLIVNNKGDLFYKKWKRDSNFGVYVFAPIIIVFYLLCTAGTFGLSNNLIFISIFPVGLLATGLIYVPVFSRRKYMNYLIKEVDISENIVSIETYKWFNHSEISLSFNKIDMVETKDESFFSDYKVFLLKGVSLGNDRFFLISDFFDENIEEELRKFNNSIIIY
ncbi:hypothetical protein [Pedobacter sp. L105]|uniref:hypothetical protein n=1 Tax=Pedobacter sp. L105 TaxID=1641871 RepID=UPI00131E975F|nr:hypothetical protein [Pedobacter sp. L105]